MKIGELPVTRVAWVALGACGSLNTVNYNYSAHSVTLTRPNQDITQVDFRYGIQTKEKGSNLIWTKEDLLHTSSASKGTAPSSAPAGLHIMSNSSEGISGLTHVKG